MRRSTLAWLGLAALALAACTTTAPDTTAPTVASHTPADGATNVSVRDPIGVTFSEAIDPASIDDSSVQLAGTGSVNLAKTLALSADGRTVTVVPISALTLPTTLTLNLTAGIRDRAGNALAPQSWSWDVPAWLRLGTDPVIASVNSTFIYWPLLVMDENDRPVVATNLELYSPAVLRRWDGGAWQDVEPPVGTGGTALLDAMAVDTGGNLVVAWQGNTTPTDPYQEFVSRWDGNAWTTLGAGLLKNASYYPEVAALVLDASGNPVIAWSEKTTPGNSAADLYVSHWNGSSWTALGGKLEVNDAAAIQDIRIVMDEQDNPIVSWGERFYGSSFVKHWDATTLSWDLLGTSLQATELAAPVAVLPGGTLVAATITTDAKVQLKQYSGPGWQPVAGTVLTTAGWSAASPALAVSSAGDLLMAWAEYGGGNSALYLAQLTPAGWSYLGDAISGVSPTLVSNPKVAMDGEDVPSLAYTAWGPRNDGSGDYDVETYYRRLNR